MTAMEKLQLEQAKTKQLVLEFEQDEDTQIELNADEVKDYERFDFESEIFSDNE